MVQPNVAHLGDIGPLPSSDDAELEKLKHIQESILAISRPISDDDARVLATLFGPDDCFGLAATLITLIETAPGWPLPDVLADNNNEWIETLRQRSINAGLLPGKSITRSDVGLPP